MSIDSSKITEQDRSTHIPTDMSLYKLFHSMDNVLKHKTDKKGFIRNELQIKPLVEVGKHSLNDECSPLAIVDFKLMQAAFKHFCEAAEGDSQPLSKESNRWKGRYFVSHEDSQEVVSEESELEKALNELQMSEISNNISDAEVLDFCNNQFSEEKSFSDSLYVNVPGELSPYRPELTPTKNVANHVPFIQDDVGADGITSELDPKEICENLQIEQLNLSVIDEKVLDESLKFLKPVKRKRTPLNTRKKRKKIFLSGSNVPKSILVRSVNSTDSSEMCFPMSETQGKELIEDDKDPCTAEELIQSKLNVQEHQPGSTAEELIQSKLNVQEHQPGSTVSSSTKKVVSNNICLQSRKKLKKNLKNIVKVKITRPRKEVNLSSHVQSSAIPLQLSEVEDCDKTTSEVIDSSETVLEDSTLIQISEQSGKSPKILNEAVSQTQSPTNSSQVFEEGNKNTCEISGTSPKTDLLPHSVPEMREKLVKSPVKKSTSKGKSYKDSCDITEHSSTLHVDSIQLNTVNSMQNQDSENAEKEMDKDSCISNSSLDQSNTNRNVDACSSYEDELDYEYDDAILNGLSESESLSPADEDNENEEMHSEDVSDGVNNSYDIEVASKASSELTCSHVNETTPNDEPGIGSPKASSSHAEEALPKDLPSIVSLRVTRSNYAKSEEKTAPLDVDVAKDIDMRRQWILPRKKEGAKKRPAPFSDDDDSSSDSEQSFKRRNNNISSTQPQCQNIQKAVCHKEQVPSLSSIKLVAVPDQHFEKFDNFLDHIRSLFANHEIVEAVNIANKYLEISNSRSARLEIFEETILGIANSISSTDELPAEDPIKETFDKLKAFIGNPDGNKKDWRFCSKIIHKYFQHPLLIEFALDLSAFCQTKSIAIDNQAIEAYATNAMARNYPTPTLIKFLDYVKRVCKLGFPKTLLRKVLERVTKGKECYLLPEFGQLCSLLCKMDPYEIAKLSLRSFVEICMQNDCWEETAKLFAAWAAKGYFSGLLLKTLLSKIDEAGIRFKKLAAEVYGSGEPDAQCKAFFGLTGLALLLESYHSGLSDKENPKNSLIINANDVLFTLHKYNVNCFHLGESWRNSELVHENKDTDPAAVICFPYDVIFTAIKICLRLEKPKNAFLIIRNYSSELCELPTILDQSLKSSVRVEHVNLFLEVTKLLQHSDPLDTCLSAFQELISTLGKGTFLDDLKGCEDVNLKEIKSIYNDLLVAYMNKSLVSNVYDLYQYSRGPCETILPIKSQVLRGLVVTFAKYQRMDEARSLFAEGCHQKIYQLEKPQPNDLPFHFTMKSNLTSVEMRFSMEKFLTNLLPILSKEKPLQTKFEDWFALKIVFKESPSTPSLINCLIEPLVPNFLSRTCSVLYSIYPEFTWKQFEDYIVLTPSTLYSYFCKNYAGLKGKAFNVIQSRPLEFGLDSDSATNLSSRSSTEPQAYPDKETPNDNFSPTRHHLPGEVSSTTSDHGLGRTTSFEGPDNPAKRRISFNSSERSSSHTPESRLSADRDARPLQLPFLVGTFGDIAPENRHSGFDEPVPENRRYGLFGEPNKHSQGEAIDYPNDMSELSNYCCKKFSPRRSTPSFSQSPASLLPLVSCQSPSPQSPSPRRTNCRQNLDNDFISQYKYIAPRIGLLKSPPMNSLSAGDESELPVRNIRSSNISSQGGFENFSVKTGSLGFSRFAKPSGSKKVNKLEKPETITSRKSISVNNSIDKDPTIFDNPPPSPKHSSPSSSPELSSIFSAPKQKAKQRLLTTKDTNPPKLPPYRIPTPCKQLKVIRPCTPIAYSSNLRCKTPISFQNKMYLNIKRTIGAASDRQRGMLHNVAPASKVPNNLEKLTVSLRNSSAGRLITTNPSRNSAATSKASATPMFQRMNMVQARCNNNVPKDVFDKIVTFLKRIVLSRYRNIDPDQLLERATTLANTFVEVNSVWRLDSKVMKKLWEFSKSI